MGAWGTAILADDFACDVRADYLARLVALGAKLRRRPPPVKRPRRAKPVDVPAQPALPSPDGSAIAFAIGNLAQVMIEIPKLGGGGGVFAASCALADLRLRWRGNATLEISHPAKAHVEEPIGDPDRFFLSGRTIALKFVKRKR